MGGRSPPISKKEEAGLAVSSLSKFLPEESTSRLATTISGKPGGAASRRSLFRNHEPA
jgi:hypothetical protein